MMTSTNLEPEAIEAAAERKLVAIREKRIGKAEAALTVTKDRLAKAQLAEEAAASALAIYDFPGNRARVLDARNDVEIARSLVDHAERELTKARARTTPEERQAVTDLVTADRAARTFGADIEPLAATVRERAGELIAVVKAMTSRVAAQHPVLMQLRHAHEGLGIAYEEASLLHVPEASRIVSKAIHEACTAAGFNPFDWADILNPAIMVPVRLATPGAQGVISPNQAEELAEVNRRFRAQMESEIVRNDAFKVDERQRAQRVNGAPAVVPSPVRLAYAAPTPDVPATSLSAERASLYTDD